MRLLDIVAFLPDGSVLYGFAKGAMTQAVPDCASLRVMKLWRLHVHETQSYTPDNKSSSRD